MNREMQKIREHIKVNHEYITDCVNDARKRRQCHGSVVQSYSLGDKRINTKQVILNIAVISKND